ncbi:hypothetical protein CMI37_29660 [Candidatus Pacearchaeota archaeon]|nr:hypothetical protein [Candidatus Pacearchaeota archaeon]
MPKKKGDSQQFVPRTPAQVVENLAASLGVRNDKRFKRFWEFEPIPATIPWFQNTKSINGLIGANKSAKTTHEIMKAIMHYTGLIPPAIRLIYPERSWPAIHRARHVRVICQDYTKHWPETIEPLFTDNDKWGMLPKAWANWDSDEHMFHGPDGSWLSIMSIDPTKKTDPNVLRGPHVDFTYVDEESTYLAYTESLARNAVLDDGPREVDLGWCPQSGLQHWQIEELYVRAYNLKTHERLPDEEQSPLHNILRLGMTDNPYISAQAIEDYAATLKSFEYDYRVKGIPTARSDDPFFDIEQLDNWYREPVWSRGDPYHVEIIEVDRQAGVFQAKLVKPNTADTGDDDCWRFWEMPQNGEKYLGILDSAEGRPGSDFQCCDIWRTTKDGRSCPPVQVGQFHRREAEPDVVAEEAVCVCTIFGECLFVFERNNTAGGIVTEVVRNYCNNYSRQSRQREVLPEDIGLLGWHTEHTNKPTGCTEAYRMCQEWKTRYKGFCGIRSEHTLTDMQSFEDKIEHDKNGVSRRVLRAREGAFDDCVTCFYIMAYIVRLQSELLTVARISATDAKSDYQSILENHSQAVSSEVNGKFGNMRKEPTLSEVFKGKGGEKRDRKDTRYEKIYGRRSGKRVH